MNRSGSLRPLASVPRWCFALLALGLAAQGWWHARLPQPSALAVNLPAPPPPGVLGMLSFGEPEVLSRILSLWLQAFDNQPGISVPYARLDYERVIAWLQASLSLDPGNDYPMLAATHLYADVPDPGRTRRMLRFIEAQFQSDPLRHWRWMASSVLIARHSLGDLPLALRLAEQLAELDQQHEVVPLWARQLNIFVLEDMGEHSAAAALLGAFLREGLITDEGEKRFLARRLEALENKR